MRSVVCLVVCVLALLAVSGCASPGLPEDPARRAEIARDHVAEGVRLLARDEYEDARGAFEAAIEASPGSAAAWNNLGSTLQQQDRPAAAARAYRRAAELQPHRPEPLNNLGLVLEQAGRLDRAIHHYHQALELDPDSPRVLGNLVRARVLRGDTGEDLREQIDRLLQVDDRPEWAAWAQRQAIRLRPPESAETP